MSPLPVKIMCYDFLFISQPERIVNLSFKLWFTFFSCKPGKYRQIISSCLVFRYPSPICPLSILDFCLNMSTYSLNERGDISEADKNCMYRLYSGVRRFWRYSDPEKYTFLCRLCTSGRRSMRHYIVKHTAQLPDYHYLNEKQLSK